MSSEAKKALTLTVAKQLATEGSKMMLQGNGSLVKEILEYTNALIDNRPSYILESEHRDKITMLAGVGLGMALQEQNEIFNGVGGMDSLVTALREGDFEAVREKLGR